MHGGVAWFGWASRRSGIAWWEQSRSYLFIAASDGLETCAYMHAHAYITHLLLVAGF
jgi:hypothetical protein